MGKFPYFAAAILLALLSCGGCSMCQPCELETYSAYGGRWQRTDRDRGRVGSVFAPAGAQVAYATPADSDVADESLPPDQDQDEDQPTDTLPEDDGAEDDSVLEDDAQQREERARRLRDLQLEDIRFQRPPQFE